jgi:hypothetical protein
MLRRTIYGIGLAACLQELTAVGTAMTPFFASTVSRRPCLGVKSR